MKQFLYLDTDIVNSVLAQTENGLITSMTNEDIVGNNNKKSAQIGAEGNVIIEGGLAKLAKAEADISTNLKSISENGSTSESKEIITKALHDAAFDIALNSIKDNAVKLIEGRCSIGHYIVLEREFEFIDVDYFNKYFEKGGAIDFFREMGKKKITEDFEKAREGHNREQLRKAGIDFRKEMNKVISENEHQLNEIGNIVNVIRNIIPYDRMLISDDGYIIPMEDKYFRVNPMDLGFKYGGSIQCVGMITNIVSNESEDGSGGLFKAIKSMGNQVLRLLLQSKEKELFIIHPIAVYYEN